jgi:protease I
MKKLLPVVFLAGLVILVGSFFIRKEKPVATLPKGGEEEAKMEERKLGKILMVLAPKDFRDEEYQKPRQVLEKAGAVVEVASKGVVEAEGMLGARVKVDRDLSQANIDDYGGVIFVGGTGAAVYFSDQAALTLARSAWEKGKVVGAICIAPSILANAGLLSGKKATAFYSEKNNLVAKGAQYTGQPVEVEGKIVTANGPQAAEEFGEKLVEVLQIKPRLTR